MGDGGTFILEQMYNLSTFTINVYSRIKTDVVSIVAISVLETEPVYKFVVKIGHQIFKKQERSGYY